MFVIILFQDILFILSRIILNNSIKAELICKLILSVGYSILHSKTSIIMHCAIRGGSKTQLLAPIRQGGTIILNIPPQSAILLTHVCKTAGSGKQARFWSAVFQHTRTFDHLWVNGVIGHQFCSLNFGMILLKLRGHSGFPPNKLIRLFLY